MIWSTHYHSPITSLHSNQLKGWNNQKCVFCWHLTELISFPINPLTSQTTFRLQQCYLHVQWGTYLRCCLLFRKSLLGRLLSIVHALRNEGNGTICSWKHGKVKTWERNISSIVLSASLLGKKRKFLILNAILKQLETGQGIKVYFTPAVVCDL